MDKPTTRTLDGCYSQAEYPPLEILATVGTMTYFVRGRDVYRDYTNCLDIRDVWGFPCGGRWLGPLWQWPLVMLELGKCEPAYALAISADASKAVGEAQ